MTLVSIGMPLYNAEKHVAEALDCLLAQTHTDFEIIISDNCSTDRTADIVEDYAARDNRITVYRQTENVGPVPNFHFVIQKAKGEFFLWRSYDDWSDKAYLQSLVLALKTNPDADLAVARLIKVRENDERDGGEEIEGGKYRVGDKQILDLLKRSHPGWMYGVFRRQVALDAINRVVRDFPHVWAWDHLILFPVVSQGRVTADYNACFYQRETGISDSRYRPRTAQEQTRLAADFYKICLSAFRKQKAGLLLRLIMPFYLLKHTSRKTEKFSRILRVWLGLKRM